MSTSLEERALKLLASGVDQSSTALALGVTASRISQLLSEDNFAERLAAQRFQSLAKHNARDEEYDALEDQLLKQLKSSVPMIMQPEKIARVLQVVNNAKRRGASAPDNILQKQTVIRLTLPVQIVNKFSTNASQQILTVNDEPMITVQSGQMTKLLESRKDELVETYTRVTQDKFGFEHAETVTAPQPVGIADTPPATKATYNPKRWIIKDGISVGVTTEPSKAG